MKTTPYYVKMSFSFFTFFEDTSRRLLCSPPLRVSAAPGWQHERHEQHELHGAREYGAVDVYAHAVQHDAGVHAHGISDINMGVFKIEDPNKNDPFASGCP